MENSFHDSFVGFVGSPNPLRSIRKNHGTVHAATPGMGPRESQQPALVPLRSIRVPRRDSSATMANEQGRNDNSPLRSIRVPRRDSAALAKGQDSNEDNFAPKPQPPPKIEVVKEQEPTPFDK